MPAIRHYRVTETREVNVSANTPAEAVQIAAAAFKHGQNSDNGVARGMTPEGIWGNTTTHIRTTDTSAYEEI